MDMDRIKQALKTFLRNSFFLPPVPALLISIPSYALVIYALSGEDVHPVIRYAAYFLSAYALIITITGLPGIARMIRRGIEGHPLVRKALAVPLIRRYLREDPFRTKAALYQGFFVNLLYVGIKLFSGIRYRSVWFITLAVYYTLLAVMRALLLCSVRKIGTDMAAEWRSYRVCGLILLFMNVALAGIVILVVHQNSGFEYPGLLIYVMALYTFYAAITAVWNVIKYRAFGSPVISAAKVISLTAALVSMLSLETAMLTQFGAAEDPLFRQIMTASTGACISLTVLGMAAVMIVRSTKRLRHAG